MPSNEKIPNVARIFSGPEDRRVSIREYYRKLAAAPIPKSRTCPICKTFLEARRDWRKVDKQWICKFCAYPVRSKKNKYRLTPADFVNIIGHHPVTDGKLAQLLGITTPTVCYMLTSVESMIRTQTYIGMQRNFPDLRLTPAIPQERPNFKRLRHAIKWTQQMCADYAGISKDQYAAIERGSTKSYPQDLLDELLYLNESTKD